MEGVIHYARQYIARGWAICPIAPGTKSPEGTGFPLHRHYSGELRWTEDDAVAYWTANPTHGIGILTGSVSGIVVADVDPRHGGDLSLGEAYPTACRAVTGGGGAHLVYRLPHAIRKGQCARVGVDRQADGGLIVAAPSIHPETGKAYTWAEGGDPGVCPSWLLESPAAEQGDGEQWVAETLASPGACPPGEQDDTLTKLAWFFAGTNLEEDIIFSVLRAWADALTLTKGPFSDNQIHTKILSAVAKRVPRPEPAGMMDSRTDAVCIRDVPRREIDWLWPGRIAFNTLTIIDGDPGVSKSLLTMDLTAKLTTGAPLYGCLEKQYKPANVLLISFEDGIAETIRPRLEVAGADIDRVFSYALSRVPTLPDEAGRIIKAVQEHSIRLVVIDPLMAAISAKYSTNVDQEIRHALKGMVGMAEEHRVAVVLIRHLAKGTATAKALYRGSGSISILGLARAGFRVAEEGNDAEGNALRSFTCNKINNSKFPVSLVYRIVDKGGAPKIEWIGTTKDAELAATAAERAGDIIREALAGGPRLGSEVHALLGGIGESQITTACKRLNVVRPRGSNSLWRIELPRP